MDLGLQGRVAIVAASNQGIGKAAAANMVVFLASDRVRSVTGVTVRVDGGLTRSLRQGRGSP